MSTKQSNKPFSLKATVRTSLFNALHCIYDLNSSLSQSFILIIITKLCEIPELRMFCPKRFCFNINEKHFVWWQIGTSFIPLLNVEDEMLRGWRSRSSLIFYQLHRSILINFQVSSSTGRGARLGRPRRSCRYKNCFIVRCRSRQTCTIKLIGMRECFPLSATFFLIWLRGRLGRPNPKVEPHETPLG